MINNVKELCACGALCLIKETGNKRRREAAFWRTSVTHVFILQFKLQ